RHRGTYTSQSDTKKGNRAGELALREAELWASLDPRSWSAYPAQRLERAWKTLLLHQFHDIIPGSGIHWVYEDTARDHAQVAAEAGAVIGDATDALVAAADTRGLSHPVVVFNAASHDRRELVRLAAGTDADVAVGPDGEESPVQVADDGSLLFVASVPSCGYSVYELVSRATPPSGSELAVGASHLANSRVSVRWDETGLRHRGGLARVAPHAEGGVPRGRPVSARHLRDPVRPRRAAHARQHQLGPGPLRGVRPAMGGPVRSRLRGRPAQRLQVRLRHPGPR